MDGWVVIGTELDTKPLDKRLRKLEAKLENEELDLSIKAKDVEEAKRQLKEVEITMKNINKTNEESSNRLKSLSKQYDSFNKRIAEGEHLTTEEYQRYGYLTNEISKLQSSQTNINNEMDKYNSKFNKLYDSLTKTETAYDKQKNKVKETKQQIIDLNNQIQKNNLQDTENKLKSISTSTENVIKKIAKWGLAIFSIRSAYNFIRQSVNTLSQYNEKLGTDIEYIRYALATSLQPLIEKIIQLVYKLLAYINYISQAWFGINIFASASVKSFEKARKSLSGSNKQAKELQKTLSGFDEMNILNDTGATTRGGGGGGVTLPSYDLGKIEDIPIPSWVQWIADNGTTVAVIIGLIGTAIAGLKLAGLVANLEKAGIHVLGLFDSLSKFSGLQIFGMIAGIAVAIVGLVETIGSLIGFINDPSWENFMQVLSGLETVLIGVGIAMVAFNATNPVGWITLAIGVLGKFIGALTKEENKTKDLTTAKKILNQTELEYANANKRYVNAVKDRDKAHDELIKTEKKNKESGEELYKQVLFGETTYDKLTKKQKEVYLAYMNYMGAESSVKQATQELNETEHDNIMAMLEVEAANAKANNSYKELGETVNTLIDNGKINAEDAYDVLSGLFQDLDGETKKTFVNQIPKSIKSSTDEAEKLRKKLQEIIKLYTNNPLLKGSMNINISGKKVFAKGGVLTYAKGGIYKPIKLASGAIVNQPGRGVPIGHNAIAGEHGAEGIIPLTDSQQMDLLGSAIAKRVVINLTNINQMNGRTISRELKQVQSEDNFAFNG